MSIPTNLTGNITSSGVAISYGNIVLGANVTIDTTNGGLNPSGADITINGTIDGNYALTLNAGTSGTITLSGSIGGTTPLSSLTITAGTINLAADILCEQIAITGSVNLTDSCTLTGNNGYITFTDSIDGDHTLTLNTGRVALSGIIGGATPLASLAITATIVNQSAALTTTGSVNYTGDILNVNGNITTYGGNIVMTGSTALNGATLFDTTGSGAMCIGANITFSSEISGGNLTLNGGTGGVVTMSGIASLTSLTIMAYTIIQCEAVVVIGGTVSYDGATATLGGDITAGEIEIYCSVQLTGPSTITSQ